MCSYDSFNACLHGKELMEVKGAKALNPVNGNDEREEVIIQIKDLPEGTEYFDQVHFMPTVKGSKYFENGNLKECTYVDVAAWTVFEVLASAQAFDIKAKAK